MLMSIVDAYQGPGLGAFDCLPHGAPLRRWVVHWHSIGGAWVKARSTAKYTDPGRTVQRTFSLQFLLQRNIEKHPASLRREFFAVESTFNSKFDF